MRILDVRFQNLNSLAGSWKIDFNSPEYLAGGIFAITGPTGAGKTTILDAICLALYGETPRLGIITEANNEIITKHTVECRAEATFETGGQRFRCSWDQHRARKKPGGNLTAATHQICEVRDGKEDQVIGKGKKQVLENVEAITGMNFQQFTRSMLLAQGEFAAFLEAPPGQRAPILEHITRTELYSRISSETYRRTADLKNELDKIKAELSGRTVLDNNELQKIQARIAELEDLNRQNEVKAQKLEHDFQWLERISRLEQELAGYVEQKTRAEKCWDGFQTELQRWRLSLRARELEPAFQKRQDLALLLERSIAEQNALDVRIVELQSAYQAGMAEHEEHRETLAGIDARVQAEAGLIQQIRVLDPLIREKRAQTDSKRVEAQNLKTALQSGQKRLEEADAHIQAASAEIDLLNAYFENNHIDASLSGSLAAWDFRLNDLRRRYQQLLFIKDAVCRLDKELESEKPSCAELDRVLRLQQENRMQIKVRLQKLDQEAEELLGGMDLSALQDENAALLERQRLLTAAESLAAGIAARHAQQAAKKHNIVLLEKRKLAVAELLEESRGLLQRCQDEISRQESELELVRTVQSLENVRQQLEDGQPCPCCGALEHPYAAGNMPEPGPCERELKELKQWRGNQSEKGQNLQLELAGISKEMELQQTSLEELAADLSADEDNCTVLLNTLDIAAGSPVEYLESELKEASHRLQHLGGRMQALGQLHKKQAEAWQELEQADKACSEAAELLRPVQEKRQNAEIERVRQQELYDEMAAQTEVPWLQCQMELQVYGFTVLAIDRLDGVYAQLQQRRDNWERQVQARQALINRINDLEKEKASLRGESLNQAGSLDRAEQEAAGLQEQLSEQQSQRRQLYGEKDPDQEEQRMASELEAARQHLEQSGSKLREMDREMNSARDRRSIGAQSIAEREMELKKAGLEMITLLKQHGFESELDFTGARLEDGERQRLQEQHEALLTEKTSLEAVCESAQNRLRQEQALALTSQTIEETGSLLAGIKKLQQETSRQLGEDQSKIKQDEAQRSWYQELESRMEALNREYARWSNLNQYIGSARGDQFRNFAQTLTFELLVSLANRQLVRLTDRYQMVPSPYRELDFELIDNYQGGAMRPVKNLSGGESFMVSLALALGLAQMSGRNAQVDSLFLDEGFGTLDEDSLEAALESLSGLQREGKIIGIISHVQALKDRIPAQIEVIPVSGGRSILRGPGCESI